MSSPLPPSLSRSQPATAGETAMSAARPSPSMIPALRYRDAPAAIDFLCRAFGFSRHLVVPGEAAGTVAHAQLTLGSGMIMLGSDTDDGRQSEYGRLIRRPGELGGARKSVG